MTTFEQGSLTNQLCSKLAKGRWMSIQFKHSPTQRPSENVVMEEAGNLFNTYDEWLRKPRQLNLFRAKLKNGSLGYDVLESQRTFDYVWKKNLRYGFGKGHLWTRNCIPI